MSHHLTLRTLLFRGGDGESQYPLAEWASEHVWTFWREDNVLTLPGIEHRLHVTLTPVCPCIVSITVNDDQQDVIILAYLFIPNRLYMFLAMFSPIIRST